VLLGVPVVTTLAAATPAMSSISNTRQDPFGTLELAGGDWLGGEGVNVYSNGNSAGYSSGQTNTVATPIGASVQSGEKWQCVELINRLYLTHGWIGARWTGNGGSMYDTAPSGLSKEANGSIVNLKAGDVVVLQDDGPGHAGIVNSVNGGTVSIVNQNTVAVYSSATISNGTLSMVGWSDYTVKGVVHAPASPASAGTFDANPSAVVGSSGTVYTLHVAQNGCAKIHRRILGTTGFAHFADVPSTCSWATAGFADMVMVPGTDNQAWMVLAKKVGNAAELYLYSMNGTAVTNQVQVGSGGWSSDAPPALSIDASGNLYIAAVKAGGSLWTFKRSADGTLTNEGLRGDPGTWSPASGPVIGTAPDGTTWLAAVKKTGNLWTFKRSGNGSWINAGELGAESDWSTNAQPGLAVDDDGDVTIAAVKEADSNGSLAWSYRRCSTCSEWHSIGQLGSTTEWSEQGTLELATTTDDRVWAVLVKQGSSGNASQWASVMTPNASQNHLGTWSGWTQVGASEWSTYSAPAVTVAGGGTVFVVKVKANGEMWAYRRDSSNGAWYNYGQIGSNLNWSGNQS